MNCKLFSNAARWGFSLFVLMYFSACHTPRIGDATFEQAEVVERIGGIKETPEWATGRVAMEEKDGVISFVTSTSMSGDARTEACTRAAEELGRANMMRHVRDAITTSGQISELVGSSDPGVESLTAFLGQGKISGVRIAERYWEKRIESSSTGARVLKIQCAAKVSVEKTILEKQLREAVTGVQGDPAIRQKLLDAQKEFIENVGKEKS